jgi:hypothetical protein
MLPETGATVLSWDLFFLRRKKKNMARPMSARPRMAPTTAPAIHDLLLLFLLVFVVLSPPVPTEMAELVGVTAAEIGLVAGDELSGDTTDLGQREGQYISWITLTCRGGCGFGGCLAVITPIQR